MLIVILISLWTIPAYSSGAGYRTVTGLQDTQRNLIKRQITNRLHFVDCVLPNYPENGKWEVIGETKAPRSTILPNKLIRFSCNNGYTLTPNTEYFVCDIDWNPRKMPKCEVVACGIALNQDFLSGEKSEKPLRYPWVAIIYKKKVTGNVYLCSGTLISESQIITAAHCVLDENNETNESKYQISVGKTYNKYGDSRDIEAQYVDLKSIVIHPLFKENSEIFRADLAILKTKTPVRLSNHVQPICLNDFNKISSDGETKTTAMWGRQTNGTILEKVRYYRIKKNEENCETELPSDWLAKYQTDDKKCMAFEKGVDLPCTGFSGSGVVFKNSEDNRYYLYGFIVLAPYNIRTQCAATPVLSVKLSNYYNFVIENMVTT